MSEHKEQTGICWWEIKGWSLSHPPLFFKIGMKGRVLADSWGYPVFCNECSQVCPSIPLKESNDKSLLYICQENCKDASMQESKSTQRHLYLSPESNGLPFFLAWNACEENL
uniref:Uncharacterized protein n=1 Tax=Salvator merianae TaxID=96440 RepID=A0A8D0KPB8_SALMN